MAIEGLLIGAGIEAAREVSTKELISRESASETVAMPVNPEALSLVNTDFVNATIESEGFGSRNGTRMLGRLAGISIDPTSKKVSARIENLHASHKLGLLDSLSSAIGANVLSDGLARMLQHNGVCHFRSSPVCCDDTAAGQVVQLPAHVPGVQADGTLLEGAGRNLIAYSAFDSGLTGWTVTGHGVNGSNVTAETSLLLFDPAVTPNAIFMLSGNPHAANLTLGQTVPNIPANTTLTLSVDHQDITSEVLHWYARRAVDLFYYNEGTGLYQAGFVSNAFPLQNLAPGRSSVTFPSGGTLSNFSIVVLQPTGGTAPRSNWVFHIQLEASRWPTSRMVNIGAGPWAGREEVDLCYDNSAGRRCWPATRGSLVLKVTPHWSHADADGSLLYLVSLQYDANNWIEIYFDGVNATKDRLVFSRRSGGVTYTAAGQINAYNREESFYVVARWASVADGELDVDYGAAPGGESNFDLYAGRGFDISSIDLSRIANATSPVPIESAKSRLQIGGKSGQCLEGRGAQLRIFPYVLNSEEMKRWVS